MSETTVVLPDDTYTLHPDGWHCTEHPEALGQSAFTDALDAIVCAQKKIGKLLRSRDRYRREWEAERRRNGGGDA